MPGARSFLGYDPSGAMVFDLDGKPTALPPSGGLAMEAMRLEAAAGRDPGAVLQRQGGAGLTAPVDPALAAALPPAPSAMGPTALAAGPSKKPSVVLDIGPGAAPAPSSGVRVGLGRPIDLTPVPAAPAAPLPQLTPEQIAKGIGAPAKGADSVELSPTRRGAAPIVVPGQIESGGTDLRALQAQADAAKAKEAAAGPVDKSHLVATPQQAGAAGGGEADPLANLSPEERKLYELRQAKIRAEAAKAAAGGGPVRVIKGGKVQTAETVQGSLGPDAERAAQQDWTERLIGVYRGKLAAIDEAAGAEQAQGQAAIEARARAAQETIAGAEKEELGRLTGEQDQLRQQIARAEVDPNRWWANKSTGQKIAVGVGMALSDLARGLIGRPRKDGEPNPILAEVMKQTDRDVEQQIAAIGKQRQDLNDLQKMYLQAKDRYGNEKIAAEATKAAALSALQAEVKAKALQAQRDAGVDAVTDDNGEIMSLNGQPMVQKFSIAERLAQLEIQKGIDARQANLSAALRGQIAKTFGFTQDRVVGGGGGGPSLDKIISEQEKQAKLVREANNDAAKANKDQKDPKGVFVGGKFVQAHPGASTGSVDKAQDAIGYSDDVLSAMKKVEEDTRLGRFVGEDPASGISAMAITGGLANASGSGVPSKENEEVVKRALNPKDPRQAEAIARIKQMATGYKIRAVQRVGGKL